MFKLGKTLPGGEGGPDGKSLGFKPKSAVKIKSTLFLLFLSFFLKPRLQIVCTPLPYLQEPHGAVATMSPQDPSQFLLGS